MSSSYAIGSTGSYEFPNPAEAHPVSLQHIFEAKEKNNAPVIVIDPRFTRTAAHADHFLQIRPGTDVPIIWGMLHHIFKNGWEDKEYINQRVYGLDEVKAIWHLLAEMGEIVRGERLLHAQHVHTFKDLGSMLIIPFAQCLCQIFLYILTLILF